MAGGDGLDTAVADATPAAATLEKVSATPAEGVTGILVPVLTEAPLVVVIVYVTDFIASLFPALLAAKNFTVLVA